MSRAAVFPGRPATALLGLLALLSASCTTAQVGTIADAVPQGWSLLDSCSGMLNDDAFRDVVIVAQANENGRVVRTRPSGTDTVTARRRSVLVLLGTADGHYTVSERNERFIPLRTDTTSEDPYLDCRIADHRLTITCATLADMSTWDSDVWQYTFAPDGPALRLVAASWNTIHRSTHEGRECRFDLLTGRYACTEDPDLEEEPLKKTTEGTIPGAPTRSLRDMDAQGSWEIVPDVFL